MKAVIQRVTQASVVINSEITRSIGEGLVVLLGVSPDDSDEDIKWIIKKLQVLRLFDDAEGFMNRSIVDVEGDFLVISQFTLFASVQKGTRPSFSKAASPEVAKPLYQKFMAQLKLEYSYTIQEGEFAADMQLSLINNGPVTLVIDSKNRRLT